LSIHSAGTIKFIHLSDFRQTGLMLSELFYHIDHIEDILDMVDNALRAVFLCIFLIRCENAGFCCQPKLDKSDTNYTIQCLFNQSFTRKFFFLLLILKGSFQISN